MNILGRVKINLNHGSYRVTLTKGVVDALQLTEQNEVVFCQKEDGEVVVRKNGVHK